MLTGVVVVISFLRAILFFEVTVTVRGDGVGVGPMYDNQRD